MITQSENMPLSQLDVSKISHNDSSLVKSDSPNLSITIDPREHHLLRLALAKDRNNETPENGSTMLSYTDKENTTEALVGISIGEESQENALVEPVTDPDKTSEVMEGIDAVRGGFVEDQPQLVTINEREFFERSLVEVGRRVWISNVDVQHYTKGCMWSPDGTCILLPVNSDGMHVIELPSNLYESDSVYIEREVSALPSALNVKEGGTVYDYAWYPFMNSSMPETCCWLASRQHEPIHMWDAFDGELRCSYRGYDEVDEVECAISVIFSKDGHKIFGGYKKSIKIFDTKIPGREYCSIAVKQSVSCFAQTDSNDNTVTVGSWNGQIKHYDLRAPNLGDLFTLKGHKGGITWLRYAPGAYDWLLLSGARKDNHILQWDMRNYKQPIREFYRNVETNQRIYFDLSPQFEWLISGDTKGLLRIWDLLEEKPNIEVQLHNDCCNGVSFHPIAPIIATTAGQYHFISNPLDDSDADSSLTINYENSLVLLWFGNVHCLQDRKDPLPR